MIGTSKNIWGFDPRTIPGCVVWLDAADTSTLTLSGSNITAWRDKSTFSNNVNSISATPPTYNSADSSVNFVSTSGTFLRGTMSQTYSNSASVFAVASVTPTPELSAGVVTTFAGNGTGSYLNGTGTNARFQFPSGVTVNGSGTVYISDTWNHRIRLITPLGVVSLLAGNGNPAFANGTGAGASFSYPAQIAVDINGNAYVADTNNHRIRRITLAGVVTTFAGTGAATSVDGPLLLATFNTPVGLTISKDNAVLFVTEANGNRIRRIEISGGYVVTVAGNATSGSTDGVGTNATFGFPIGIAPDPFGNLYVVNPTSHRVRKIVIATGVVTTFAGSSLGTNNGTGTNAQFNYPSGVTCDELGNVYVAEADTPRIRKITPDGVVTTFAGSGTASSVDGTGTNATFSKPRGMFYYTDGIIYVADEVGHRIRKMNTKTVNLTFPQVSSLGSNAATENNLIGQAFEMQGVTPNFLTFVENTANPTGLGSNIQTYLSNTLLNSKLILANTSTYSGTPFGITSLLNGTTQTFTSRTGNLATNSSNVSTYNKYAIGGMLNVTATVPTSFNGKIFEYLVFNSALTTTQRQQIEGYLTWKWERQTSLPVIQPYYSIKPHLQYFQPSDIAGLSVWFDAADMTTITGSSPVTAWRDKSGNRWNATTLIGTAPTTTTVNGLNAVSFPASSTLTVSNVLFSLVQSRAIFVVYRVPTSAPNYISWFSTQASGINNQGGHNNLVIPTGGGGPYLQSFAVGGAVQGMGADPAVNTIGTTALAAMIHSSVSTASNVVTLNGTSYTLTTNTLASGYGSGTVTYYIGNAYPQAYILCEYILYQREFTVVERQQVEAYLAWKWGITSSLPATHPYKTIPIALIIPAAVVDSLIFTGTGSDAFVVKYDLRGNLLWARRLGGTSGDDAWSVATDSSGNVIVTGLYSSTSLNIYATNGTTVSFTLTGSADAFVVKYDSSGTPLWARKIGGGGATDIGYSVRTDSSGNIVVAGQNASNPLNIFAADGSTVSLTLANNGNNDAFVVKYDSSGTPLWARRMGGTGQDIGRSVSTDSSGNIVVVGYYASNPLNIYAANGSTVSFTLTGGDDAFVVKYDSSGTPLWARRLGGTSGDDAWSVATDSSGNIIVTGVYSGNPMNIYAANGTTVSFTLNKMGSTDTFVVKYDSSGTPLWARRMGTGTGTSQVSARSVSTDSSGNIVVVGFYRLQALILNTGDTISFMLTAFDSNTDVFVVKYDSSGTPLWARRMAGGSNQAWSVSTDLSGNIIVAGHYTSPINILAANGSTILFTLANSGNEDAFVVKYDSSGTPLWARRMGGTGQEYANSVTTDSSGNIVVAGRYSSPSLSFS
jgi:sugar lactone lactonase YvrE